MNIITYLLLFIIGYTLTDIFGDGFTALKDIRYWIIIFSAAGINLISLYVK